MTRHRAALVVAIVMAANVCGQEGSGGFELPPLVPRSVDELPTAASPPAEEVPLDLEKADHQWRRLLELGRRRGRQEERQEVLDLRDGAAAPWVERLARNLLEEWRFPSGHSRMRNPRRVWAPPMPPLPDRGRARAGILVRGTVEIDTGGRVVASSVEEGSGDDQLDFELERWARAGRYRPALDDRNRWRQARDAWAVELGADD